MSYVYREFRVTLFCFFSGLCNSLKINKYVDKCSVCVWQQAGAPRNVPVLQKNINPNYGTHFYTQTQGKSEENTHPSFAVSICSSIFTKKFSSDATLGHVDTETRTSIQHRWDRWGSV